MESSFKERRVDFYKIKYPTTEDRTVPEHRHQWRHSRLVTAPSQPSLLWSSEIFLCSEGAWPKREILVHSKGFKDHLSEFQKRKLDIS